MHRHKSLGLLTGVLVLPRVGYRVFAWAKYNAVSKLPGSGPVESAAAKFSHIGLYGT